MYSHEFDVMRHALPAPPVAKQPEPPKKPETPPVAKQPEPPKKPETPPVAKQPEPAKKPETAPVAKQPEAPKKPMSEADKILEQRIKEFQLEHEKRAVLVQTYVANARDAADAIKWEECAEWASKAVELDHDNVDAQSLLRQIPLIDAGDLELSPRRRLQRPSDIDHLVVVEVQPSDGPA